MMLSITSGLTQNKFGRTKNNPYLYRNIKTQTL